MLYRTNQYQQPVYQFETKPSAELPKPIYLKALTLVLKAVLHTVPTKFEDVKRDFQEPGRPPSVPSWEAPLTTVSVSRREMNSNCSGRSKTLSG